MQNENQIHIDILKNIFPDATAKEFLNEGGINFGLKVHTDGLTRKQLEDLVFSVPDAVDINIKRSGTGLTVILTNK